MPDQNISTKATDVKKRRRNRLLAVAALAVVLFAATEGFCRLYLGLGDPPLSMNDAEIGYLFKPSQTCRRFGNTIRYNAYSMRSDDFPAKKSSADELRVMVLGDSIVNGGVLTDHSHLSTSLLRQDLAAKLQRPVVVGNISAGGWGPLNEWAYVRKHGWFDADVVVLVLNSQDSSTPFSAEPVAGVDPNFPAQKPWCATWEAATRYLPKYLSALRQSPGTEGSQDESNDPKVIAECSAAVKNMISTANKSGAKTYVLLHWTRAELARRSQDPNWRPPGHRTLEAAASDATVVDLGPELDSSGHYRDYAHLNEAGHALLARRMGEVVRR